MHTHDYGKNVKGYMYVLYVNVCISNIWISTTAHAYCTCNQRQNFKVNPLGLATFSTADGWAMWHLCKAAMHAKQNNFILDRLEHMQWNWVSRIKDLL